VKDLTTGLPAVGALPVNFVRSPDRAGPGGGGRFLVVVNSGYGLQFDAASNKGQQSLSVIDLSLRPPAVTQNVYFPEPQSANVGAVFSPRADREGAFTLLVSGGFENKVWMFDFRPETAKPISPYSDGPDTKVGARFVDLSGLAARPPDPRYNDGRAAVYPAGLALSPDGEILYVASNLGDSLGVVRDLKGGRALERIDLAGRRARQGSTPARTPGGGPEYLVYPYDVAALARKVYVSCWNDESVAAVDFGGGKGRVSYVPVGRHPTALKLNPQGSRLYVVNSNDDSVSVIDTGTDREVERVGVRLAEGARLGSSPEGLALSEDGRTLYVANAHSNSVAVVTLSGAARGVVERRRKGRGAEGEREEREEQRSAVRGFVPTGQYPSAVAVANGAVFVGNGKGTGFANSSTVVDNSGRAEAEEEEK
jgi:YVTN family beta-propeller protein